MDQVWGADQYYTIEENRKWDDYYDAPSEPLYQEYRGREHSAKSYVGVAALATAWACYRWGKYYLTN